jgi:TATA-box binding protein (TBP) (component of TFIID and TFIIIB)
LKLLVKGFLEYNIEMENLNVSTITAISKISSNIELKDIYDKIPINDYIPFIEYGHGFEPRGFSKKLLKKTRKKKVRKIFYNQSTIHVTHDNKIVNVKLFNNGKLQLTGLKKVEQGYELINDLIEYFKKYEILKKDVRILDYQIVLINSDFDLGIEINRETLHREIIDSGIYSSYEPCIYPGVNIKYFINENISDGICPCNLLCDGKGRANGDGECKKVTIAVFKSGKTIITGGQNEEQLVKAYTFITTFINERKDLFVLK